MRRNALIILFASLFTWSGISSAAIVEIDSAASIIHTSGGFSGSGYGDLAVSGSFNVTVSGNALVFENIDVVVTPAILNTTPYSLPLPTTTTYDGTNFSQGIYCIALEGVICPTDNTMGSYDGTNFVMNRLFFSGYPDDYSYDITIVGTVSAVPVPAAIWLFASGFSGLLFLSRNLSRAQRKIS